MYREMNLGEIQVKMLSNAATPYRYKQVFQEDLLAFFSGQENTASEQTEMVMQLAYIMAMQAEKADFTCLNFEKYLEWAEQFDLMDLMGPKASKEILEVYMGNTKTSSSAKKNNDQQ